MTSLWLPIDSAPRDETSVDIWVTSKVDGFEWRIPNAWFCPAALDWCTSDGEFGEPGRCLGPDDVATHWMAIPEAPTRSEGAAS